MAVVKFTSSQGAFSWATTGAPGAGLTHLSQEMLNSNITEVRANFDWLIDNQETCWANKTTRCNTLYSTYRTTNNGERQTVANDSQKDTYYASRYITNDALYCSAVNNPYHAAEDVGHDSVIYSSACSTNNSALNGAVNVPVFSVQNFTDNWSVQANYHGTANDPYNGFIHTSVRTSLCSPQYSAIQSSDHGTRDGNLYTSNQATNHASVDAVLDCQAN